MQAAFAGRWRIRRPANWGGESPFQSGYVFELRAFARLFRSCERERTLTQMMNMDIIFEVWIGYYWLKEAKPGYSAVW